MNHQGAPKPSERKALRDAYVRSGKVPLGTLIRVGLRDGLIQPLWLPLKYLPGAVGMKLRQWVYARLLAEFGRGTLIDVGVEVVNSRNVKVGSFTLIDKYCQLHASEGSISIGARCHIAPFVIVFGHGGVIIEDYVGVASGAKIFSISEWPGEGKRLCGPMIPDEHRGLRRAPVRLERDSLIGANVVVMPGVTVGQGAVVGSNAVVTHDIPPWTIAVGAPAKPVGKRDPVTVEDMPTDESAN